MTGQRDERGAVVPFVAIMMTVLIAIAALVVDIGHQRVQRRDVQAIADMVALDMARHLDGRTHAVIKAANTWRSGIAQSVARNSNTSPLPSVDVKQQQTVAEAVVAGSPLEVDVEMGVMTVDGEFTTIPYPQVPTAVRVTARSSIDYAFAPGTGDVARTSVASVSDPNLCFSVGTRTLALNTEKSALSPLLTHILKVNLDAVGYAGLVDLKNLSIPLAGLAAELNAGSTSALLAEKVTLGELLIASADALARDGDAAAANVLRSLHLRVPGSPITVGELLKMDTANPATGLTGEVNVLDLLMVGAVVANGDMGLGIDIPGVASIEITEPPQIACGRAGANAESAQIRLVLDAEVPGNPLIRSHLGLRVEVGSGSATLNGLSCDPMQATFAGQTGTVSIGKPDGRAENLKLSVPLGTFLDHIPGLGPLVRVALELLGLNDVGLDVGFTGVVGQSVEEVVVQYPSSGLPDTITIPQDGLDSLLQIQSATVWLSTGQNGLMGKLGDLLNPALNGILSGVVMPLVSTTLNPLLTSILSPALSALGIKVGVADIALHGRPACETVRLVQ